MVDKQLLCHIAVFIAIVAALCGSLLTYVLCLILM